VQLAGIEGEPGHAATALTACRVHSKLQFEWSHGWREFGKGPAALCSLSGIGKLQSDPHLH
jgi:hypothetical protein